MSLIYEGTPIQDTCFIEKLYKDLGKATKDLEQEQFKIFPREYYRGSLSAKKENLFKILRDIAKNIIFHHIAMR
ncbi:MAG: hypothetical protein FAF03_06225 [Epsilonproteobacteria bacterium]|nr:hypothetical protein [Campylobacterota bacterium]